MIKKQKSTEYCHICCHMAANKLKLSQAAEIGGRRLEKEVNIYSHWSKKRLFLLVKHCHHSSHFRGKVKFNQLPTFIPQTINNAKRWRAHPVLINSLSYKKYHMLFIELTPTQMFVSLAWTPYTAVFLKWIWKPFQLRCVSCISDSRMHILMSIIAFYAFMDKVTSRKWAVTFPQRSCWQLWTHFVLQEGLTNVQSLYCLNYLKLLMWHTADCPAYPIQSLKSDGPSPTTHEDPRKCHGRMTSKLNKVMTGMSKGILISLYIVCLGISALSVNVITAGMIICISSFWRILQSYIDYI